MDIIGSDGKEIYFKQRDFIESKEPILAASKIQSWLEEYNLIIPYDATILGVLEDQVTIDNGRLSNVTIGREFKILRPTGKKKHPLLDEIVEWQSRELAIGRVFNVSEMQARGSVQVYFEGKNIQRGDWVKFISSEGGGNDPSNAFPDVEKEDFGKLGEFHFSILAGTGYAGNLINSAGGTNQKLAGFTYGVEVGADVWATRNYFGAIRYARRFGSYSEYQGSLSNKNSSFGSSEFKLIGGYKYLPLGFFYGPQIDGYLGYSTKKFLLESSTTDKFGDVTYSGILIGIRGDVPVYDKIRAYLETDFAIGASFESSNNYFSGDYSVSMWEIGIGARYNYNASTVLGAGFNYSSQKAKFDSPSEEMNISYSSMKLTSSFSF